MNYYLPFIGVLLLLLFGCKSRDDTKYSYYDNNSLIGGVDPCNPIDISKWTCNKLHDEPQITSFSVIIYRPNGIMNMNDVIQNDSSYYQACMACSYNEGHLKDFFLYGTEGKYKIEKNEIDSDFNNVPLNREISIKNSRVYDLMKKKVIFKNKEDSIVCFDNDSLYLYIIRK